MPDLHVNAFLLLTDTPARAGRLAREIAALGPSLVVDLLDPNQSEVLLDPAAVRAVIADVVFRGSTAVAGIKRHLDRLGGRRPPLVCLLHEDTPRARTQALALGAMHLLPANKAPALLAEAFRPLGNDAAASAPAAAVTNTGFTVPISAKTGTPRAAARASNAIPPRWLPVKATAAMAGASTT